MISVSCPDCGKGYRLDEKMIGKMGRCKACDTTFPIEDPSKDVEEVEPPVAKRPSSKTSPISRSRATHVEPEPDDELAGLNSVSSEGEEYEEAPRRRTRKSRPENDEDESPRPKKKKRKSSDSGSGVSFGGPLAAVAAAGGSGLLGAVIWGAIAYFAHVEVGYVAWAIGGLVGFSVRVGAGEMDEGFAGVIAAIGSVISILLGKLLSVYFVVTYLIQKGEIPPVAPEQMGALMGVAFAGTFGIVDIVFFVLAIMTAYRLGSGNTE